LDFITLVLFYCCYVRVRVCFSTRFPIMKKIKINIYLNIFPLKRQRYCWFYRYDPQAKQDDYKTSKKNTTRDQRIDRSYSATSHVSLCALSSFVYWATCTRIYTNLHTPVVFPRPLLSRDFVFLSRRTLDYITLNTTLRIIPANNTTRPV
jgi:hypothetical protein